MVDSVDTQLGTSPDEVQFRFRGDDVADHGTVTVDSFVSQSNANAVRIEPGDDARALIAHLERLALVEVSFPVFGDGRGYSAARILREAGYTGELRAVGEILIDQLGPLRRCGFDAFAPDRPLNEADAHAAWERWPQVYQSVADARQPIWTLRHDALGALGALDTQDTPGTQDTQDTPGQDALSTQDGQKQKKKQGTTGDGR